MAIVSWQSLYPSSGQNGVKTIPLWWHISIWLISKGVPPERESVSSLCKRPTYSSLWTGLWSSGELSPPFPRHFFPKQRACSQATVIVSFYSARAPRCVTIFRVPRMSTSYSCSSLGLNYIPSKQNGGQKKHSGFI